MRIILLSSTRSAVSFAPVVNADRQVQKPNLSVPLSRKTLFKSHHGTPHRVCHHFPVSAALSGSVPHETNFQNPQISIHLSARSALVRLAAEKSSCPWPQNLFQPRSSSTSITVSKLYCSSPTKHTAPSPTSCHPSTLLKTHSHRVRPHRGAASFKSLYQKRPPADSDEATNFSSAVASETTLGLLITI